MNFGLSIKTTHIIWEIFRQYPAIEKAIIYGSRAKGTYKNGSDIDLTLIGKDLTSNDLLKISQDLDDSIIPYLVDISLFKNLDHLDLRLHIQRVGMVFYEKNHTI